MKRLGLIFILILMVSLTGCINKYQLTDKQSDMEAEYMAGALLKHDKNYKEGLLDEKDFSTGNKTVTLKDQNMDAAPTPTPAAQNNNNQEIDNKENSTEKNKKEDNYTIAQVFGTKDFDIQYSEYKLYDEYPKDKMDTYFSITPRQGYQLLVASFKVKNIKKDEKRLNLSKAKITYQLDVNTGTYYKPLFALLENGLRYLDLTLGGGKEKTVLLVFEVSKDIDLKNINLIISRDNKTEIVEIK